MENEKVEKKRLEKGEEIFGIKHMRFADPVISIFTVSDVNDEYAIVSQPPLQFVLEPFYEGSKLKINKEMPLEEGIEFSTKTEQLVNLYEQLEAKKDIGNIANNITIYTIQSKAVKDLREGTTNIDFLAIKNKLMEADTELQGAVKRNTSKKRKKD